MASAIMERSRGVRGITNSRLSEHGPSCKLTCMKPFVPKGAASRNSSKSCSNSQLRLSVQHRLRRVPTQQVRLCQDLLQPGLLAQGFVNSNQGFLHRKPQLELRKESASTKCQVTNGQSMPAQPTEPGLEEPLSNLVHGLEGEQEKAIETARKLIGRLNKVGREAVLSALFETASENIDDVFKTVDLNSDGILSKEEFSQYVEAQAIELGRSKQPPTQRQLFLLSVRAAIGNIGFGFTDNVIMILAGDVIQNSIGTGLGLSTLMSAGLGNCIADVIGAAFKESIEGASGHFMPDPKASPFQLATKEAWWAETTGASVGIAAGCIMGLSPLFIMGRWRAVDDVQVVERSADVELVGKHAPGTSNAASIVVGAALGRSGDPSCSEGAGGGLDRLRARERVGERATDGNVLTTQVEYSTAVVEVPRRSISVRGGTVSFGEVWVFVFLGMLMCVRRLYDLRRRRR